MDSFFKTKTTATTTTAVAIAATTTIVGVARLSQQCLCGTKRATLAPNGKSFYTLSHLTGHRKDYF